MKQPELKSKTNEFWSYLNTRAKFAKGWDVESVASKDQTAKIRFTCIHGRRYEEDMLIMGEYDLPKTMASQSFLRAVKWCKGEHVDLTPNTWYSIETVKLNVPTITWPTMKWIDASDFTITWDAPAYTNMVYGGGGRSVVSELLSICPGLGKVQRPCPECKGTPSYLTRLIPHVNDEHKWSREKIAEWLDIIALDDPAVDLTIQPKEKKREQPSISPSFKTYEEIITNYAGAFTVDNTNLLKEILGAGS